MVLADPMVDHLTTELQAANDALAELRQSNARLDVQQQVLQSHVNHVNQLVPSVTHHSKRPNDTVEALPPSEVGAIMPHSHATKKRQSRISGSIESIAIPTKLNTADDHEFDFYPIQDPSTHEVTRMPIDTAYTDRVRHFLSKQNWSPTGHSLENTAVAPIDHLFSPDQSVVLRDSSNALTQHVLSPLNSSIISSPSSDTDIPNAQMALTAIAAGHSQLSTTLIEPSNIKQAFNGKNANAWRAACEKELSAFRDHDTYSLVPLPEGIRSLGSRWVFTVKGEKTAKARLVAQGHRQIAGIDYTETFAPVVRYDSVRIYLALSACLGLQIHQMDVNTAFLNSPMDEPVYVRQPPSFIDPNHPDWVWKLSSAMYGLKQAPLLWNKHINATLTSLDFQQHAGEHGLYFKRSSKGIILVALYVDDLLIAAPDSATLSSVKASLSSFYSMKDLGPVNKFLGMNVVQTADNISLSLTDYIIKAANSSSISLHKHVYTPISSTTDLFDTQQPALANVTPYQSIVGQLLFISNTGRPDIAHSVSLLSRFLKSPTELHLRTAHHVLQYLYTT